jgi:hypothetical protein
MVSRLLTVALVFCITLGCVYHRAPVPVETVKNIPSPYQQFIAKNFDWSTIHRVVMMPVANQSAFPNVNEEIQKNLAIELQRVGRFEIVVAKINDPGARAVDVFASGQFNEIESVRVAREYQADAILFVNVTHYHPYNPPRVGLSLLLISPAEGIPIASLSGLWDAREAPTLQLAQAYVKQSQNWSRSLLSQDRVLESPDVFQRFVCQQVSTTFQPNPPQSVQPAGMSTNMIIPAEAVESNLPMDAELPPIPPTSMNGP